MSTFLFRLTFGAVEGAKNEMSCDEMMIKQRQYSGQQIKKKKYIPGEDSVSVTSRKTQIKIMNYDAMEEKWQQACYRR